MLPTKQWIHTRHAYFAGNVLSQRFDVDALALTRLTVRDEGQWNPERDHWGEGDEPPEPWAKDIGAHGARPVFEMEQVVPGVDPEDMMMNSRNVLVGQRQKLKDGQGRPQNEPSVLAQDAIGSAATSVALNQHAQVSLLLRQPLRPPSGRE